jgi:hypothetical protein
MNRSLLTLLTLMSLAAVAANPTAPVTYPSGYRDWRHVKSMVIEPGHPLAETFAGVHHLYANEKALEGYAKGTFPDGSIIVFDLLEAVSADRTVTEGSRKLIGVMVKDGARYAATGGWGFEGFAGDSKTERLVADKAATACFGCHQAQKSRDYVFSSTRP